MALNNCLKTAVSDSREWAAVLMSLAMLHKSMRPLTCVHM